MEEVVAGVALMPMKFEMTTNAQAYQEHIHRFNDHHMYAIIYNSMERVKEHTIVIVVSGGGRAEKTKTLKKHKYETKKLQYECCVKR